MTDLLTPAELEALDTTATLARQLLHIIGEGPTATADWAETCAEIHAIQNRILSQAAARAYPDKFRVMGASFGDRPTSVMQVGQTVNIESECK